MNISDEILISQLQRCNSGFELKSFGQRISGKVRDSYIVEDKRILVTSDRLSAFDVILTTIPFKGQILNDTASFWFEQTSSIIENHLIARPHPLVLVCQQLEIIPIEVVMRAYLTGSAWRDYQAGRSISGITLEKGMKKNQKLSSAILTPATKALAGEHDLPISRDEILSKGIVEDELWSNIEKKAAELFQFGQSEALKRGLILVDTKYEFGLLKSETGGGELILADEVHTPDSSRYWIADSYQEAFETGQDPIMLDKEFVRTKLMQLGFMGDGPAPVLDDGFRVETAKRYIKAYESLTGLEFKPAIEEVSAKKIEDKIRDLLKL